MAPLVVDPLSYLKPHHSAGRSHRRRQRPAPSHPPSCLKGSIILTTNRGASAWGDIFGDTTIAAAMPDRLLHRCAVINITGDSYRLRAHQARTRQHTTTTIQPPQSGEYR